MSSLDVALRDGSTTHLRRLTSVDEPAMVAFLDGLSDESRWLRFFSGAPDLRSEAERAVSGKHGAYGLIATSGPDGRIVAHAGYVPCGERSAEVSFAVADSFQGRGLATTLLGHLAAHAHDQSIEVFRAYVVAGNLRMIEVLRESGFPVEVSGDPEILEMRLATALAADGWTRYYERERSASVAAVRSVLAPGSVAVIGASRRRGTVGGEILHNLVRGNFQGPVYPVNRGATSIQAMPAYPSVLQLPAAPELAVIAVPAAGVLDVARECGQAGVRGLVVVSAGFGETGPDGARAQRELIEICREYGMRLVGPNCLGVLNTASAVQMNATFMPRQPVGGRIGFLSQSGGLGIAIVDAANTLRLGLSSFVSVGNKADLSGNDFMQYWEQDPDTNVILMYLESFGNARKFARIARRVARSKPIVAVKSGRSTAGARATSSHTGALLAASDVTVDALFGQAGVIRTDTLAEMFDVAALLSAQPTPAGRRVAIVTNAGGPAILCADACEAAGLKVVELSSRLRSRLRRFLPGEASLSDPVDMIATASAEDYRRVIETLGRSGEADAIIAIFVPPLVTQASEVAQAISSAAEHIPGEVALLSVFMGDGESTGALQRGENIIPAYAFPEDAARALGHAVRYGEWRAAPAGSVPALPGVRSEDATAVIANSLAGGEGWLDATLVARLLDCYGIRTPGFTVAHDPAEAARVATQFGGHVALKAMARGLVHKSDVGAVRVGLRPGDVQWAANSMIQRVTAAGYEVDGLIVQAMAPAGPELIVGVVQDPIFGPLVACGAGGTSAELLGDVAARLTPLTDLDAREMLRSLRTFPLLDGYRGAERCDTAAIEELLLRVSALVEDHPEIAELDLNPVVALPDGALAVDARIRLENHTIAPALPSVVR